MSEESKWPFDSILLRKISLRVIFLDGYDMNEREDGLPRDMEIALRLAAAHSGSFVSAHYKKPMGRDGLP